MLNEKGKILKIFNAHFQSFIQYVADSFPANDELRAAGASFELVRRANPTIIIKVWKSHIYMPYKEVIDRHDLTFITEKNYEEDLSMFANVREILDIIDRIRAPIKSMDEAQKAATMKFVENLSKLACLYA